jgi:hypothetical protein
MIYRQLWRKEEKGCHGELERIHDVVFGIYDVVSGCDWMIGVHCNNNLIERKTLIW